MRNAQTETGTERHCEGWQARHSQNGAGHDYEQQNVVVRGDESVVTCEGEYRVRRSSGEKHR